MLETTGAAVRLERSTSKTPLDDEDVRQILRTVEEVLVTRGKSVRELDPKTTDLEALKGPTGKFRAPIIQVGGTLLVGFNAEVLRGLIA